MADQRPFDALDQHEPVLLCNAANSFEAGVIVASLDEAGIDARFFDAVAASIPLSSQFMRVPIFVQRADLAAAQRVLAEQKVQAASIDWDSVDVGSKDVETRDQGSSRFQVVVWWLLGILVLFVLVRMLLPQMGVPLFR